MDKTDGENSTLTRPDNIGNLPGVKTRESEHNLESTPECVENFRTSRMEMGDEGLSSPDSDPDDLDLDVLAGEDGEVLEVCDANAEVRVVDANAHVRVDLEIGVG